MTKLHVLAAILMFALATTVLASEMELPVAASRAKFESVKTRVLSQLEADTRGEIKLEDRRTVLATLDRMDALYDKAAGTGQFNDQDRMDMFNDQEIVITIVTHAPADSRMTCEREATTGSHQFHVTCMTLAMRKAREVASQEAMDRVAHKSNSSFPGAETMQPGKH